MKLLVILLVIVTLKGQSRIDGQIVDKETGEPLIGVNVFISKTSIGTTTDKDGLYTIKNISKSVCHIDADDSIGFVAADIVA